MYKIQGTDQKEYGPVNAEVMRQWIAERRVDARTLVQADGTTGWKPLAEFPEFASTLPMPRPLPSAGPSSAPIGPVKTSGLAVASLVMGILGCLGITSLLGILFGIISLVKISKSQGRLKGTAMAVIGLCLSALMLFMALPILGGLLYPALQKAKGRGQSINCVSNLKQLALGCRMYAEDNKDQLPNGATWCSDLQQYTPNLKIYRCQGDTSGQRCSYALNARIAGKKVDDINPSTVLLFETPGGWNASGGPELVIPASRHGMVVNVAFADGSVMQMPASRLSTLRWDP